MLSQQRFCFRNPRSGKQGEERNHWIPIAPKHVEQRDTKCKGPEHNVKQPQPAPFSPRENETCSGQDCKHRKISEVSESFQQRAPLLVNIEIVGILYFSY